MIRTWWTPPIAEITDVEVFRLYECETVIERGMKTFVDVGNALLEIRDDRLYRTRFETFEDYCQERWNISRPRAYQLIEAATVASNLSTVVDIIPTSERQTRPLTSLDPDQQRAAWTRAVETAPEGKITAAHVQSVVDEIKQPPHVSHNSGNNEWYTPPEYIEAARRVMGDIDIDPASSAIANHIVGATVYYTADDDGLSHKWTGRVWMNPPYSGDLVGRFTEKLVNHFEGGDITEAIVLVNNATETAWFQRMLVLCNRVCFLRGRVKYLDETGIAKNAPLQGQAILYFGKNHEEFTRQFMEFGKVLRCD